MRILMLVLLLAVPSFGQSDSSAVYHDNVVMVVDASGSMDYNWTGTSTDKMVIAKRAMKTISSQIDENTQIGIVVFGGGSHDWVYPLGLKNEKALLSAIDSIQTGGGTPLGTYIKKGADALVEQRKKQFGYGSYRLLIVTDGSANSGSETTKMKEYTEEIISRGINVDVIGVDMGSEHALAKIVGDNYRAADNPESLAKAITEVFAEVSRKDADDAAQSFDLFEGLDPALAKGIIGALSKPQNHLIGEKPRLKSKQISSADGTSWEVQEVEPVEESNALLISGGVIVLMLVLIGAAKASTH